MPRGFIKCRLVHLRMGTILLPDLLFSDSLRSKFWTPDFFYPPILTFSGGDSVDDNFTLPMASLGNAEIIVKAMRRDLVRSCTDGAQLFRCYFHHTSASREELPWRGKYRRRGDRFELRLYHHTTPEGQAGILSSGTLWASKRNIQGNRLLSNIAYGYFTSLQSVQNEKDLQRIAMSESGLTGLLPVNAPLDPRYARLIEVPRQTTVDRSRSLTFWVDSELLAPTHLWIKRPLADGSITR